MILSGYLVIGKQKSEWRTGPQIDAVGDQNRWDQPSFPL